MIVIEDVDLIARAREDMNTCEEATSYVKQATGAATR